MTKWLVRLRLSLPVTHSLVHVVQQTTTVKRWTVRGGPRVLRTADLHAFPAMLAKPRSMRQRRVRAARVHVRREGADFLLCALSK